MAQGNRSKEVWLIPKRVNLHQTICLLDGIIERNYDRTTWNPGKQNNLGVNLKKLGATRDGKNISPQAIRTLFASIPQYLGFAYINVNTTPNTVCITKAGYELWNYHKGELEPIRNLVEDKDKTIQESEKILYQMEKLQITNPVILKDCENIFVFPFRITLKLLLELEYLDIEELAYFVFQMHDESEFELTLKKIKKFREMPSIERKEIIEAFKKTHIGNITLVQAASSGYYQSLCVLTGIIDKIRILPNNLKEKLSAITIKEQYKEYVKEIIYNKYTSIRTYDFKNNLDLWIEYIGNPDRISPPIDISFENHSDDVVYILIKKDEKLLNCDVIPSKSSIIYPLFMNEEYDVEVCNYEEGKTISKQNIVIERMDDIKIILDTKNVTEIADKDSNEEIIKKIIEHSECTNFAGNFKEQLEVLNKVVGINKLEDKSLRGAYYEYLFFKLLSNLKAEGKIDEVIWNGKIGKYLLPMQAPGGKTGTCDIVFTINNTDYVLELTTIKSKSMQFSAECSSVPDHIRLHSERSRNKTVGIFVAPLIHMRNENTMKSVLNNYNLDMICLTDKEFINIIKSDNIYNELDNLTKKI